jgi:hypothetical protein
MRGSSRKLPFCQYIIAHYLENYWFWRLLRYFSFSLLSRNLSLRSTFRFFLLCLHLCLYFFGSLLGCGLCSSLRLCLKTFLTSCYSLRVVTINDPSHDSVEKRRTKTHEFFLLSLLLFHDLVSLLLL